MNHKTSSFRTSPICCGATKNFTVLLSSASGVRLTRSIKALCACSYVVMTSCSVAGGAGSFTKSIAPSGAAVPLRLSRPRPPPPAPPVHQLPRRAHPAVPPAGAVRDGAVRRLHVDAVPAARAQVDLGDRRGHVAWRLPLLHLFRDRPRPEDPLPRRREGAAEPEGDGGDGRLPLSGGHGAVSWLSGSAR